MTSILSQHANVLTVQPARWRAGLGAAGELFNVDVYPAWLCEHVGADLVAQPGAATEQPDLGRHYAWPGALLLARHSGTASRGALSASTVSRSSSTLRVRRAAWSRG